MSVAAGTRGRPRTASFVLLGDERLARLAAAGHDRAFAVVYERHHQALYRYCRSILRHDADAQDALQSTFAAAYSALARGQRDAPIRPWLFRIAHNEAVSALRRRRPTAELSAASDAYTSSVEEQVAERAELGLLLNDLRRLTARQRSALVMRELSGLSHEEIAIALGTSVGAAKQTIYEARRSLFEFAEGRAMDCDEIRRTISDADGRALRSRRVRAHLRECAKCRAFAAAIPARTADLRALAPALPAVAAAGLLERIVGVGAAHSSAGGIAGLTAAATGKTAGAAFTANALAGVAVAASATVGVTIGIDKLVHPTSHRSLSPSTVPGAVSTPSPASSRLPATPAAPGYRLLGSGQRQVAAQHRPSAPAAPATAIARPGAATTTTTTMPGLGHHYGAGGLGRGSASGARGASTAGSRPGNGLDHAGSGRPATAGSGRPATAGSGRPTTAGSGRPATAGSGRPSTAGSGRPTTAGSGRPTTPGSGRPATAGSQRPATAGSQRPDTAGSGPPPWAGSGRSSTAGLATGSPAPTPSTAHAAPVQPSASKH